MCPLCDNFLIALWASVPCTGVQRTSQASFCTNLPCKLDKHLLQCGVGNTPVQYRHALLGGTHSNKHACSRGRRGRHIGESMSTGQVGHIRTPSESRAGAGAGAGTAPLPQSVKSAPCCAATSVPSWHGMRHRLTWQRDLCDRQLILAGARQRIRQACPWAH